MYPAEMVKPMAKELTDIGFESLKKPSEVEELLGNSDETILLVVNSVCGCAAGNARPGVKDSLEHEHSPEKKVTVFAGVDKEATEKAREYLKPYPPSSPAIALFKDGQLVHMLERHHIEGRAAQLISENLKAAYDSYCADDE